MRRLTMITVVATALVAVTLGAVSKHVAAQTIQLADAKQDAANQFFSEGLKLYQAGNFEGAKGRFELGFTIHPGNAVAHYYFAETLKALGDLDIARSHYEKASQLGPETKEGIMAAAVLKNWQGIEELGLDAELAEWKVKLDGVSWCAVRGRSYYSTAYESYTSTQGLSFSPFGLVFDGNIPVSYWEYRKQSLYKISHTMVRDGVLFFEPIQPPTQPAFQTIFWTIRIIGDTIIKDTYANDEGGASSLENQRLDNPIHRYEYVRC